MQSLAFSNFQLIISRFSFLWRRGTVKEALGTGNQIFNFSPLEKFDCVFTAGLWKLHLWKRAAQKVCKLELSAEWSGGEVRRLPAQLQRFFTMKASPARTRAYNAASLEQHRMREGALSLSLSLTAFPPDLMQGTEAEPEPASTEPVFAQQHGRSGTEPGWVFEWAFCEWNEWVNGAGNDVSRNWLTVRHVPFSLHWLAFPYYIPLHSTLTLEPGLKVGKVK